MADEVRLPFGVAQLHRERLLQPVYRAPVIYPGRALRNGEEATVVVHFVLARDGSVARAEIVSNDGSPAFADSALRAVRGSRYAPEYQFTALRHRDAASVRVATVSAPVVQRTLRYRLHTL